MFRTSRGRRRESGSWLGSETVLELTVFLFSLTSAAVQKAASEPCLVIDMLVKKSWSTDQGKRPWYKYLVDFVSWPFHSDSWLHRSCEITSFLPGRSIDECVAVFGSISVNLPSGHLCMI